MDPGGHNKLVDDQGFSIEDLNDSVIREGKIIHGKGIANFKLGMTYETVSEMLNYVLFQ